jgi:hypothetical protein
LLSTYKKIHLMPNYTYLSLIPDHLDDGQPLSFGTAVSLTTQQERQNTRLLDSNALVPAPKAPAKATNKNETLEVSD